MQTKKDIFERSTPLMLMLDISHPDIEAYIALAEKFVDEILTPEISDVIKAHFKYNDGCDPEAATDLFQNHLKHDVILAIRGYDEFAASRIFRSQNFNPQPLPICNNSDLQKIALRFALRDEFVKPFFARLTKSEITLPILGKIMLVSVNPDSPEWKKLQMFPNEASIREWASYYNWSESAE